MAKKFRKLKYIENCEVHEDLNMARLTTMRVGGRAACVAIPQTVDALQELIKLTHKMKIPMFPIGGGSNTVFMDDGFDGVIVKYGKGLQHIRHISGYRVYAGAGADLRKLVSHSLQRSLAGMEYCVGIPGTVGGALAGNAGTHGVGICEYVSKVWGFTPEGERYELEEFPYGYRYSWLRGTYIVGANFMLKGCETKEDKKALRANMKKLGQAREGQPYRMPSAGCIFKNPTGDSAGRLIDLAGLKGYCVGGIEVSKKHANFIVNTGNGKAEDLVYLICYIRQVIKEKYDVDLALEVQLVSSHPMTIGPSKESVAEGSKLSVTTLKPSPSEPILNFV